MHRTGSSSKRSSGVLLYVLGRLAHASALDIWRWVSQLPEIPPTLMAPPRLTCVDMITELFPEANSSWVEACRLEFLTDHFFSEALNEKMVEKRRRRVNWMEWHEFLYMAVRYSKPRIVFERGCSTVSRAQSFYALSRRTALVNWYPSIFLPGKPSNARRMPCQKQPY